MGCVAIAPPLDHSPSRADNLPACACSLSPCRHNFLFACALSCCLPLCSTIIQRQAVAKHSGITSNLLEDIALSCCCPCCITAQCAMQMGDNADITCVCCCAHACHANVTCPRISLTHLLLSLHSNFKLEYLTKPPSKQEIEAQAHEATHNAADAKTDNPLAK